MADILASGNSLSRVSDAHISDTSILADQPSYTTGRQNHQVHRPLTAKLSRAWKTNVQRCRRNPRYFKVIKAVLTIMAVAIIIGVMGTPGLLIAASVAAGMNGIGTMVLYLCEHSTSLSAVFYAIIHGLVSGFITFAVVLLMGQGPAWINHSDIQQWMIAALESLSHIVQAAVVAPLFGLGSLIGDGVSDAPYFYCVAKYAYQRLGCKPIGKIIPYQSPNGVIVDDTNCGYNYKGFKPFAAIEPEDFSKLEPMASGGHRDLYVDPVNPNIVYKVYRQFDDAVIKEIHSNKTHDAEDLRLNRVYEVVYGGKYKKYARIQLKFANGYSITKLPNIVHLEGAHILGEEEKISTAMLQELKAHGLHFWDRKPSNVAETPDGHQLIVDGKTVTLARGRSISIRGKDHEPKTLHVALKKFSDALYIALFGEHEYSKDFYNNTYLDDSSYRDYSDSSV